MNKKFIILICLCLAFFACNRDIKDYITRDWVVNSIELDGVNYGTEIMSLNLLSFEDDHTGTIPWVNSLDTIPTVKGKAMDFKWSTIDSNDKEYYIEIHDSKVDYFNDTFEVVIVNEDKYSVKFKGKRVKLNCQGIYNLGIGVDN